MCLGMMKCSYQASVPSSVASGALRFSTTVSSSGHSMLSSVALSVPPMKPFSAMMRS